MENNEDKNDSSITMEEYDMFLIEMPRPRAPELEIKWRINASDETMVSITYEMNFN